MVEAGARSDRKCRLRMFHVTARCCLSAAFVGVPHFSPATPRQRDASAKHSSGTAIRNHGALRFELEISSSCGLRSIRIVSAGGAP